MEPKITEDEPSLRTIKFLSNVTHTMQAEVARTDIPLQEVMLWKKDTIVDFNKVMGSPIEILIGERLIARGEIVLVNEKYGVRISEITHPDEKPGASRRAS